MAKRGGLGRGLDALIPDRSREKSAKKKKEPEKSAQKADGKAAKKAAGSKSSAQKKAPARKSTVKKSIDTLKALDEEIARSLIEDPSDEELDEAVGSAESDYTNKADEAAGTVTSKDNGRGKSRKTGLSAGRFKYDDETDDSETGADETDDSEVDADETDDSEVDADETDDSEVDADETDDSEIDADETDDSEIDADETDDSEVDDDETDDIEVDVDETDDSEIDADETDADEIDADEFAPDESADDVTDNNEVASVSGSRSDRELTGTKDGNVIKMRISLVEPNRDQPRKYFDDDAIEELADSIRQFGIIQPLLVQKKEDYYEIIAGERRWRAAQKAGLKEVPVIIKNFTSQEAVEVSLIENIQREDLNPIEEAKAYERLVREYGLSQEAVAGRVSKSRSAVTNSMRLLKLEESVQKMVETGALSEGHARALLGLSISDEQKLVAEAVVKDKLSVRQTEKIVRDRTHPKTAKKGRRLNPVDAALYLDLAEQLKNSLGTKVSILPGKRKGGKIEIEYYSEDELDRLFELLRSAK